MTVNEAIARLDELKEDAGILFDAVYALRRQGLPLLASSVELAYTELCEVLQ